MKKINKVLWWILAIMVIIFGGHMVGKYLGIVQTNADSINKNDVNQVVNGVMNNIKNEMKNEVKQDEKTNKIDNAINEEDTNTIQNTINESEQKEEPTSGQTGEENRQKAINMAKKEWGEDDNVSFKIDEQTEDGKFVISVVDKNTTKVIFWYNVDVKNNTIEEK